VTPGVTVLLFLSAYFETRSHTFFLKLPIPFRSTHLRLFRPTVSSVHLLLLKFEPKMPYCHPCDRFFNTYNGYDQHIQNSAAHRSQYQSQQFECDACDRCFATEHALHQHSSNAAGHPYCVSCKRMFMNQNNLNQVGIVYS
jgi:hypothetical protein